MGVRHLGELGDFGPCKQHVVQIIEKVLAQNVFGRQDQRVNIGTLLIYAQPVRAQRVHLAARLGRHLLAKTLVDGHRTDPFPHHFTDLAQRNLPAARHQAQALRERAIKSRPLAADAHLLVDSASDSKKSWPTSVSCNCWSSARSRAVGPARDTGSDQ